MKKKSEVILSLASLQLGHCIMEGTDETALIKSIFGQEKRAVIRESVQLDRKDEEAFWPVFETFEMRLKKLDIKRERSIKEFQGVNTVESAIAYADNLTKWGCRYQAINRLFYNKLRKTLGGKKTLAFFRLQVTLQAILCHETFKGQPPASTKNASAEIK